MSSADYRTPQPDSPLQHFVKTARAGERMTYATLRFSHNGRTVDVTAMKEAKRLFDEGTVLLTMRRRSHGRLGGAGSVFDLVAVKRVGDDG